MQQISDQFGHGSLDLTWFDSTWLDFIDLTTLYLTSLDLSLLAKLHRKNGCVNAPLIEGKAVGIFEKSNLVLNLFSCWVQQISDQFGHGSLDLTWFDLTWLDSTRLDFIDLTSFDMSLLAKSHRKNWCVNTPLIEGKAVGIFEKSNLVLNLFFSLSGANFRLIWPHFTWPHLI